jgi:hypothetical protein
MKGRQDFQYVENIQKFSIRPNNKNLLLQIETLNLAYNKQNWSYYKRINQGTVYTFYEKL